MNINHPLQKYFGIKPLTMFYIVFGYIIVFSIWWAILLYQKNETAFNEKVELNKIFYTTTNPTVEYTSTKDYQSLYEKYGKQKQMILSEGLVFIILLFGGLWQVLSVFLKEIELNNQQTNFLLSITHELKSPLASIKLSLETIERRDLEATQVKKFLTNSLSDVDRLESLVENILFAAKIESNTHGLIEQASNLSTIVNNSVKKFEMLKKNIVLKANVAENVILNIDPIGFTSVVYNLIENAIKYSPINSEITINLQQTDTKVFFTIADKGIGIAENEKNEIFKKFYRVGNEDTRKTKGTGLGLFIVKRFVEITNSEIEVLQNEPQGTIFKITFYKPI